MRVNQTWVNVTQENERQELVESLKQEGYEILEIKDNFPIIIDETNKFAFTISNPSACGCFINAGGKILSYEEFKQKRR